jgi:hypothetical protein
MFLHMVRLHFVAWEIRFLNIPGRLTVRSQPRHAVCPPRKAPGFPPTSSWISVWVRVTSPCHRPMDHWEPVQNQTVTAMVTVAVAINVTFSATSLHWTASTDFHESSKINVMVIWARTSLSLLRPYIYIYIYIYIHTHTHNARRIWAR